MSEVGIGQKKSVIMASSQKPLPCSVCGASVPGGASACPECGARVGAGERREYVLHDPFAEDSSRLAQIEGKERKDTTGSVSSMDVLWDSIDTRGLEPEPQDDREKVRAEDDWQAVDGVLDLTQIGQEMTSLESAASPKKKQGLLQRLLREDGPEWSPITWLARLHGWGVERQIRQGRRYVAHGVGLDRSTIEFDPRGLRSQQGLYRPRMSPFSAAFAGLIPGLGNLWMRQWFRAAGLGVPGLILFLIVLVTWTSATSNFWVLLLAAWMIVSYDCAERNYHRLLEEDCTLNMRFQMLLFLALSLAGVILLLNVLPCWWILTARNAKMEPLMTRGESAFYSKWTAFRGGVRKGDIVHYIPKRFAFLDSNGRSGNVQEKRRIERVLAVGGDTVEIRDHQVFINSRKLEAPVPLYPKLLPASMPARTLVRDEYWVLYGNIQSDNAIVAYSGQWNPPPDWDGLPEGARLHASTWRDACVVRKDQIIGVVRAVFLPPTQRRWLK